MAQTQKVTIQLGFKSDTTQVKKNLSELSRTLHEISNMEIGLKGGDLDQARNAARQLTVELQKAINVDTGKLDLNKLTTSLRKSKTDLVTLSSQLLQAGTIGQQSFLQIARAVSSAEIPALKLNKSVKSFIENLGNTMKWQIAQNAVHGLQSVLQGAVREAEQLNKALNDIRIVTGYDSTAMAQFAKQANKAAKELRTTTKEYAEASLIFYQQGLTGSEATKRAETVIKLAQVTNDSARSVSDQMTAIWNNFDDGTKSLEYYADAMAKLGADTAASTSEIANGLEKFAAIAETVGLSYETAMASVATVIDKTRQSADVVGTAFKTIFARVQGLSLDGVTDDGVSLNKYSQALEAVGVDILTASGELRDMDAILEDLGSKWEGLGRETQVAIAQTVGGARQYNQILSLMDNWTEVQENINKASNATGELQNQADIWAEGYEAASERVKEASARAYENFLNSDQIVALTNVLADIIESVDNFIDRMGGIIPIGLTLVAIFSKKLLPVVRTVFGALADNILNMFGRSKRLLEDTQTQLARYVDQMNKSGLSEAEKKQLELTKEILQVKQATAKAMEKMSDDERADAEALLDIYIRQAEVLAQSYEIIAQGSEQMKNFTQGLAVTTVGKNAAQSYIKQKHGLDDEAMARVESISKQEPEKRSKISSEERESYSKKTDSQKAEERRRRDEVITEGDVSKEEYKQAQHEREIEETILAEEYETQKKSVSKRRDVGRASYGTIDIEEKVAETKIAPGPGAASLLQTILSDSKEFEIGDAFKGKIESKDGQLVQSLDNVTAITAKMAQLDAYSEQAENLAKEFSAAQEAVRQVKEESEEVKNASSAYSDAMSKQASISSELEQQQKKLEELQGRKNFLEEEKRQKEGLRTSILEKVTPQETRKQKLEEYDEKIKEHQRNLAALPTNYSFDPSLEKAPPKAEEEERERKAAIAALQEEKRKLEATYTQEDALLSTAPVIDTTELDKVTSEITTLEGQIEQSKDSLTQATQQVIAKEKAYQEVLKKSQKALKPYINSIKENKTRILELAKASGKSDKELEELTQAIDGLSDDNAEGIVVLLEQFDNMREDIPGARGELQQLRDQMLATIKAANPGQDFTAFEQGLGKMEKGLRDTALRANATKSAFEQLKEKFKNFDFSSFVSGLATIAGGITALAGATKNLWESFSSGSSVTEKIMAVMTFLASSLPTIVTFYELWTKLQKKKNDLDNKEINNEKKKQLENLKTAGTEATKAGAKIAGAIASVFESGWGIAALAVLAAFGLAAGINAAIADNKEEKQHEQNEQNLEAAETSNELADATYTESQSIDELTAQYNKLKEAKEDTLEITKDILEQASKAIEEYKEYADTVALDVTVQEQLNAAIRDMEIAQATGSIEEFNEARKKADLEMAKAAAKANQAGIDATISEIQLLDADGVSIKNGNVNRHVGGSGTEEATAVSILQKYKFSGSGTGADIKLRTSPPEAFLEDYNALQDAVNEMKASSNAKVRDPGTNDTLRECMEILSAYRDKYETLRDQLATQEEHNVMIAASEIQDAGNITNFSDFRNYQNDLEKQLEKNLGRKATESEKQTMKDWLKSNSELEKYVQAQDRVAGLTEKGFEPTEGWDTFLKKLESQGLLEYFLDIDVNAYKLEQDILKAVNRAKDKAEREEIQLRIKGYDEILETLKPEGMTEEDWTKIAESDVFRNDHQGFLDFLGMSYNEQVTAIAERKSADVRASTELLQNTINSLKDTMAETEDFDAYIQAAKELEAAERELAIREELIEQHEKWQETVKKSDIIDVYAKINQELEKLQRNYKKLQTEQNNLFGADRIKKYDELIDNLKEQNERTAESIELTREDIISEQLEGIKQFTNEIEMPIFFDEEGYIDNINDILDYYAKKVAESNPETKAAEQAKQAEFEKWYNEYQELLKLLFDYENLIDERELEQKTLALQKIVDKTELKLSIDDMKSTELEYYFEKLSKSIYTSSQAVTLFTGQLHYLSNAQGAYTQEVKELDEAYERGELNENEYIDRLQTIYDACYSNIEAIDQLSEELINFYGETLQKAQEEIDKYTDRMEHAASVLEHYKTLLELTGKSSGAQMKTVLEGAVAIAFNNLETARSVYEMYREEALIAEQAFNDYVARKGNSLNKANDFEYQRLEKAWQDSAEAVEKAQEDILSKTAEWGESMKALIEHEINEISKALEKAFTGGISFEELTTSMERASLLQEDYLTTTNKIYETTKLMRTAQNAIDASTNNIAKQKLKSFVEETKQLQSQGKLSSVELDIQQKKYDLLVAEIALQDAQNAKSTVRLTRTADGGFGYVYTADESKIEEAQQQYEDAENALYNTRLEAANSYAEKSIQAQQQLTQELQDLHIRYLNGEFESREEYERRREELIAYYTDLLLGYSRIYSTAISEDARISQEAWSTEFATMVTNTDRWKDDVEASIQAIDDKLRLWDKTVVEIQESTGINLTQIGTNVEAVKDKVTELKDALIDPQNGVVPAVDKFIEKGRDFVNNLAASWSEQVNNLTTEYTNLADQIQRAVEEKANLEGLETSETKLSQKETGDDIDYQTARQDEWRKAYIEGLNRTGNSNYTIDKTKTDKYNKGGQEVWQHGYLLGEAHANALNLDKNQTYTHIDNVPSNITGWQQAQSSYYYNWGQVKKGNTPGVNFSLKEPEPIKYSWTDVMSAFDKKEIDTTQQLFQEITGNKNMDINKILKTIKNYYSDDEYKALIQNLNNTTDKIDIISILQEASNIAQDRKELELKNQKSFYQEMGEAIYNNGNYLGIINPDLLKTFQNKNTLYPRLFTTEEHKALEALIIQLRNGKYKGSAQNIIDKMIEGKDLKDLIPDIKKSLDFDIAKNYMNKDIEVEVPFGGLINLFGTPSNQVWDNWGTKKYWLSELKDDTTIDFRNDGEERVTDYWGNFYAITKEMQENWIDAFDTGGYTGTWGPEGKLAMLHQKEIILNADDTANFLASLDLLHSILKTIDIQAANAQFSSSLTSSYFTPTTSEILEQNVHIEASFPGISEHNELELALTNLINQASQYANRK